MVSVGSGVILNLTIHVIKLVDFNPYLNKNQINNQILAMDQFFTDADYNAPQITEYQPPQHEYNYEQTLPTHPSHTQSNEANAFDFGGYSQVQPATTFSYNPPAQNEFNDFEQDQTTRRIREEEERVQTILRQKSHKEWNDKNERQTQARAQLEQFRTRKEQQKQQRARQNIQKQDKQRQQYNNLKGQQGWHKVISSINLRQGEHKGKKDINRMREAILHRREDETGK